MRTRGMLLLAAALVGCTSSEAKETAGLRDAASSEGADAEAWSPPEVTLPDPESDEEFWLSQVGLYQNIEKQVLAPDLIAFAPDNWLWTDGAGKHRWMRLPPGTQIDTSDMDNWVFPVGTMLFKEFSRDDKVVETRLIKRTGPGRFDYWMGAFIWNDGGTDALFTPKGQENARGTEHDVPPVEKCHSCHNGSEGRILGMAAVQQTEGNGETNLSWLADRGLLSDPPEAGETFAPPGDEVAARAIGYLHANCGHCHNPSGAAWPDTDLQLKYESDQRTVEDTNLYQTTVGIALQYFDGDNPNGNKFDFRVVPGKPDESALLFRMSERGTRTQMPTIGTELTDPDGLDIVRTWIASLDP